MFNVVNKLKKLKYDLLVLNKEEYLDIGKEMFN